MKKKEKTDSKSTSSSQQKIQLTGKPSKSIVNFNPTLGSDDPMKYVGQSPAASTLSPGSSDKRAESNPPVVEALDMTARRKRANLMRRLSPKLTRIRRFTKNQFAPRKRLKRRAQKMARSFVRTRYAGTRGKNYSLLSPTEKMAVDRLIKNKAKLIVKLASRLVPVVRKAEALRLKHVRTKKKRQPIRNAGGLGLIPKVRLDRADVELKRQDILCESIAFALLGEDNMSYNRAIIQYKNVIDDTKADDRFKNIKGNAYSILDKILKATNIKMRKSNRKQEIMDKTVNEVAGYKASTYVTKHFLHPSQNASVKVEQRMDAKRKKRDAQNKPVAKKKSIKSSTKPKKSVNKKTDKPANTPMARHNLSVKGNNNTIVLGHGRRGSTSAGPLKEETVDKIIAIVRKARANKNTIDRKFRVHGTKKHQHAKKIGHLSEESTYDSPRVVAAVLKPNKEGGTVTGRRVGQKFRAVKKSSYKPNPQYDDKPVNEMIGNDNKYVLPKSDNDNVHPSIKYWYEDNIKEGGNLNHTDAYEDYRFHAMDHGYEPLPMPRWNNEFLDHSGHEVGHMGDDKVHFNRSFKHMKESFENMFNKRIGNTTPPPLPKHQSDDLHKVIPPPPKVKRTKPPKLPSREDLEQEIEQLRITQAKQSKFANLIRQVKETVSNKKL